MPILWSIGQTGIYMHIDDLTGIYLMTGYICGLASLRINHGFQYRINKIIKKKNCRMSPICLFSFC